MSEEIKMSESLLDKLSSKYDLSEDVQLKIAGMVDKYKSLDESGKSEFLNIAKRSLKDQLGKLMADRAIGDGSWLSWLGWQLQILAYQSRAPLIFAIMFLALFFVFFGYKLYKSLSERERKREEKKKSKQMKKKK